MLFKKSVISITKTAMVRATEFKSHCLHTWLWYQTGIKLCHENPNYHNEMLPVFGTFDKFRCGNPLSCIAHIPILQHSGGGTLYTTASKHHSLSRKNWPTVLFCSALLWFYHLLGPVLLTWIVCDPGWIANYIHGYVWDEMNYPFQTSTAAPLRLGSGKGIL